MRRNQRNRPGAELLAEAKQLGLGPYVDGLDLAAWQSSLVDHAHATGQDPQAVMRQGLTNWADTQGIEVSTAAERIGKRMGGMWGKAAEAAAGAAAAAKDAAANAGDTARTVAGDVGKGIEAGKGRSISVQARDGYIRDMSDSTYGR